MSGDRRETGRYAPRTSRCFRQQSRASRRLQRRETWEPTMIFPSSKVLAYVHPDAVSIDVYTPSGAPCRQITIKELKAPVAAEYVVAVPAVGRDQSQGQGSTPQRCKRHDPVLRAHAAVVSQTTPYCPLQCLEQISGTSAGRQDAGRNLHRCAARSWGAARVASAEACAGGLGSVRQPGDSGPPDLQLVRDLVG